MSHIIWLVWTLLNQFFDDQGIEYIIHEEKKKNKYGNNRPFRCVSDNAQMRKPFHSFNKYCP